ncbi:MAG: hypothetical protein WCD79_17910 [Chthoniobacteraceae bacterium]
MSNWITLNSDDLIAAKHSTLINALRTSGAGVNDPVVEAIAEVTATVRAAVSAGNALDADTTKIPASWRGRAVRMIVRLLKSRIEYPESAGEQRQAQEDAAFLTRSIDQKLRFEAPDNPDASAEMQPPPTPRIRRRRRLYSFRTEDGI